MPETRIVFFQDEDGKVPVVSWLNFTTNPETYTYLEPEEAENEEN